MIILQAVQAPLNPPNPNLGDLEERIPKAHATRLLLPTQPTTNPALPLLLTNRQLYHETLDTLQRAYSSPTSLPPSYSGDVIYLRDNGTLWPTWLSVPFRASHADTVHAQFRIFRCPPGLTIPSKPAINFFHYERFYEALHGLLESVLASGRFGPCGQPITVDRLVLNFLPAAEVAILPVAPIVKWEWVSDPKECGDRIFAKDIRPNIHDCFYLDKALKGLYLHDPRIEAAARFMCWVFKMLQWIAEMNYYTFSYGKVLFEHVGVIEVHLDGKLYKTLDLGARLARLPSNPQLRRPAELYLWKREVEAKRRKLGWPVENSEV